MINLLPPIAKKRLKQERVLRFISLFIVVLSLAVLVLFIFSIPTWVVQKYQLSSAKSTGTFTADVEAEQNRIKEEGVITEQFITHIAGQKIPPSRTVLMSRLDELSGEDVELKRFSFDSKNKVTISGVATTRPALSSFRDRLAAEKGFSSVELPLSSLVNENNPDFTITLVVK